jgi:hypothetical protein
MAAFRSPAAGCAVVNRRRAGLWLTGTNVGGKIKLHPPEVGGRQLKAACVGLCVGKQTTIGAKHIREGIVIRQRQAAWPVSDNYLGRSTG